ARRATQHPTATARPEPRHPSRRGRLDRPQRTAAVSAVHTLTPERSDDDHEPPGNFIPKWHECLFPASRPARKLDRHIPNEYSQHLLQFITVTQKACSAVPPHVLHAPSCAWPSPPRCGSCSPAPPPRRLAASTSVSSNINRNARTHCGDVSTRHRTCACS